MVTACMALRCSSIIVVAIVVVVVILTQGAVIATVVTSGGRVLSGLCIVCVVLSFLACLLPLASLHACLLKQSTLLCKPAPLLSVLHLVLSDQGLRRSSEDVFVFAELADPGLARGVVEVGVLLLRASFASRVRVELGGTASGLAGWGRLLRGLGTLWRRRGPTCRLLCAVHTWACLCALSRYSRGIWSNGRASASGLGVGRWRGGRGGIGARRLGVRAVFLAGPNHLVG